MKKSVQPYRPVSLENSLFSWTFSVVSQALPSLLHSRQLFHTFPSNPNSPVPLALSTLPKWSYFSFYWEIKRKETFPQTRTAAALSLTQKPKWFFKSTPAPVPILPFWSQPPLRVLIPFSLTLWRILLLQLPPLYSIMSFSLPTGLFPSANKHAIVSPLLKNLDIPVPFRA